MRYWILICALLISSSAYAQTPPPATSYELQITGTSSSTYSFAASTVICNSPTEPGTAGIVNPRFVVWDDPNAANRFCYHDTGASTGPLFALPFGDYSALLVAIATTTGGTQARSLPSNNFPFSRLVPPVTRTGVHVRGA